MKTSLLDYHLPRELIAGHPAKVRRRCRLLCLDRSTGAVTHYRFDELPLLLDRNDLLVVNDTAVIPARLLGHCSGGGKAEIFLLEYLGQRTWRTMVRPGAKLRPGTQVSFAAPLSHSITARIVSAAHNGTRTVRFDGAGRFDEWLRSVGQVPIPPYIKRAPERRDRTDYQTVFAQRPGAVAAPTAGLHFDHVLLDRLREHGIGIVPTTLHVGAGTFRPITAERLEDHVLESERFSVSGQAQRRIWKQRRSGQGRVIAVGTTVTRVLETIATDIFGTRPFSRDEPISPRFIRMIGRTQLFIRPGHRFEVVEGLITNFHLPRSSLLALVVAFASQQGRDGLDMIMRAYETAVREKYRFYSYGDAMLIL